MERGQADNFKLRGAKPLKTPSQMEVAPWIADWIMMVSDGIRWYCMVFDGIAGYYMVFDGIQ